MVLLQGFRGSMKPGRGVKYDEMRCSPYPEWDVALTLKSVDLSEFWPIGLLALLRLAD